MPIGVLAATTAGKKRVAASPETAKMRVAQEHTVQMQSATNQAYADNPRG